MAAYGTIKEFLQATIALIAIANPLAALPVFLSRRRLHTAGYASRIEPSLRRNRTVPR
jgi:small neutral amino acid transporter SnatA (MarC family)